MQIEASHVTEIIGVAGHRYPTPDLQMSLLVRAVICAAKTLKIPRHVIAREIDKAWDDTYALVRRVG